MPRPDLMHIQSRHLLPRSVRVVAHCSVPFRTLKFHYIQYFYSSNLHILLSFLIIFCNLLRLSFIPLLSR
ncbi:hypothetical protein BDZ91DRAFT_710975 [Kalaharituber pfeilii]|nr:hypothetical protein BDZ91DRAFT_710975 [Kalaharituber pfeilii]